MRSNGIPAEGILSALIFSMITLISIKYDVIFIAISSWLKPFEHTDPPFLVTGISIEAP